MPLVRSRWLGKKKGKEAWVRPIIAADPSHPSGRRVDFEIGHGAVGAPGKDDDGTMDGRRGAVCVACGALASVDHVRTEALAGRMGQALMSTVAARDRQRVYIAPDASHVAAAAVGRPQEISMARCRRIRGGSRHPPTA
jgi:putative DNA methylase